MKSIVVFFLTALIFAEPPETVILKIPSQVKLKKGLTQFSISLKVKEGFHIQANPASLPQMIPTTFQFEPLAGVEIVKIDYPKGLTYRQPATGYELSAYQGEIKVRVGLKGRGATKLKGSVRYQACDEKTCYPPRTDQFEVNLSI